MKRVAIRAGICAVIFTIGGALAYVVFENFATMDRQLGIIRDTNEVGEHVFWNDSLFELTQIKSAAEENVEETTWNYYSRRNAPRNFLLAIGDRESDGRADGWDARVTRGPWEGDVDSSVFRYKPVYSVSAPESPSSVSFGLWSHDGNHLVQYEDLNLDGKIDLCKLVRNNKLVASWVVRGGGLFEVKGDPHADIATIHTGPDDTERVRFSDGEWKDVVRE